MDKVTKNIFVAVGVIAMLAIIIFQGIRISSLVEGDMESAPVTPKTTTPSVTTPGYSTDEQIFLTQARGIIPGAIDDQLMVLGEESCKTMEAFGGSDAYIVYLADKVVSKEMTELDATIFAQLAGASTALCPEFE